jgi:hypothetical protein
MKGNVMISVDNMNEIAEDACTHGLYASEVDSQYQAYYIGYLINVGRQDLIDIERKVQ